MAASKTRERSGAVFGNQKFLEVVLVVDRAGPIHAQAIAEQLGVASTLVAPVLTRLEKAGLIRVTASRGTGNAKPYQPVPDSQVWMALVNLCQVIAEGDTLF